MPPSLPETRKFQAETTELLELVVHSLYSNKQIFLRELVSNASDAIDRRRFEALTRPELAPEGEPGIRLRPAVEDGVRTLTIEDDGIGMTRSEVIENLGTIAHSGTKAAAARLKEAGAAELPSLIGQFGVGFYSAFIVADEVTVVTRRAGEPAATRWQSRGKGEYTVGDATRETAGTTVTLRLRDVDAEAGLVDFTDKALLAGLVKKTSDFVRYPITVGDDRAPVNSRKALWHKKKGEATAEELAELYKHLSHDWEAPLEHYEVHAEGAVAYDALLFVPKRAPWSYWRDPQKGGLALYVKSVKVLDDCAELLPRSLRFVRGVVDSPDLPLNVSRELLQQDRQLKVIKKGVTKKVLDGLAGLLERDRAGYEGFWRELGRSLKEGIAVEHDEHQRLGKLFLFESTALEAGQLTTLDEAVARMKPGQDALYYLTGESRRAAETSPHLEAFKAKGIEVLFLTDPVDEFLVQELPTWNEKPLKSIASGEVALGSEDERKQAADALKAAETDFGALLAWLPGALDGAIKDARLSSRLTSSPACLVVPEGASANLERLMKRAPGGLGLPPTPRTLELNPEHALVKAMRARHAKDLADPVLLDQAHVLLGMATLAEGSPIEDVAAFNARLVSLATAVG